MTPWTDTVRTCELCGHTGPDVKGSWARWRKPRPAQKPFDAIDRCVDRAACRARCEAMGDEWPVADLAADMPAVAP